MSDSHRLLYCDLLKNLCVFVHPYSWPCNRLRLLISGSEVRALHGSFWILALKCHTIVDTMFWHLSTST